MNSDTGSPTTRKNLRALFGLAFALNIFPAFAGGILLKLSYAHAEEQTQPMWKFGQYILILGLLNVVIYFLLLFQVRRALVANS